MPRFKQLVVTVCLLLLTAVYFAVPCAATPHTPKVGSSERKAILDALREPVEKRAKIKVTFVVVTLRVENNWAWISASSQDAANNKVLFGDMPSQALLKKQGGHWQVVDWDAIADDTSVASDIARKYPQAPRSIFGSLFSKELPLALKKQQNIERRKAQLLEKAMTKFTSVIRRRDTKGLLSLVRIGVHIDDTITYPRLHGVLWAEVPGLRADLKNKGDLYNFFFLPNPSEGSPGIRMYEIVEMNNHTGWIKLGADTFFPKKTPLRTPRELLYIKWKFESGAWYLHRVGRPVE